MTKSQERLINITTLLVCLLAITIALYAINLLIVGGVRTIMPEVSQGAPQGTPQFIRVPYPPAIVPLVAATLLLSGFITRKLPIAWIGQTLLSLFAVLFLFSSGGQLLPTAGLLLILLTLLQTSNFQLSWMLFIVLLAAGVSLWFGLVWPYSTIISYPSR
ncbi:MAG: hypothetical protein C4294_19555 [Nitrospiraceae bacterium]